MVDTIINVIISMIIMIPIYGVLLWTYFYPEESYLFGNRWMYKEEPEISRTAIRYAKFVSITLMLGIPFILLNFFFYEVYLLRLVLVVLPLVLIFGAFKIFTDEKHD
ncbi:hypothetical protein [Peribacillus alkalitolerans]|uniref:hypothetical protein n=1 Tax=Peribacillus alkalitolerans TaxID=1550385 RepID=UPI0019678329|nr:hypothetical protein [Peribacillus alkalitolerans]